MITNIDEIKKIRKKTGMTQKELAKVSGVSQSAIAKIESGLMDPGFSLTKKIFEALQSKANAATLKAKDVMNHPVKTIPVETEIKEIVSLMRKKNFSQFPVTQNSQVVGMISESNLLDAVMQKDSTLRDVMDKVPPTVANDTPLPAVVSLLHYYPLVLVSEKGKITGIITKTDILMSRK